MKKYRETKLAVTGNSWMVKNIGSIQSLMKETLSKSKDEVLIAAYNISGNKEFIKMLDDLVVRGIRVTIVVNKFYKQFPYVQNILKKMCNKYSNLFIFSFEPENRNEDLHAKLIVVDHRYALVGSANLSGNGLFRNHEMMVRLSGRVAAEIGNLIEALIKSSNVERVKI